MTKLRNREIKLTAVITILIAAAVVFRILSNRDILPTLLGIARTVIYIGMIMVWGISVSRRIIHVQVRRYLCAVSALMVFWMAVRTMKFFFTVDINIRRILWYLYYLPMLFIPLLALLIALSIGKPEDQRLSGWTSILYVPAAVLFLLALTNDYHQLIFHFNSVPFSDSDCSYSPLYWFVVLWEIGCAVTSIIIMILKCCVPKNQNKFWLPMVPIIICIIYSLLYISEVKWLKIVFGDITAFLCLSFIAAFESCIRCGLIRSNTGYDLLFHTSTLNAQITDEEYNVCYASAKAENYPKDILRQTEGGVVYSGCGTLLKGHRIHAGHIIWQEDVTELENAMDRLNENYREIAAANAVYHENYITVKRTNQLREQNRLYDLVQTQTAKQFELLNRTLDEFYSSKSEETRRRLLARAAVLGAYIKRRGNLILLYEKDKQISVNELSLCLRESVQNLELLNISCEYTIKLDGTMPTVWIMRIYDLFEDIVDEAVDHLQGLWVYVSRRDGIMTARMEAVADTKRLAIRNTEGIESKQEDDGSYVFILRLTEGRDFV